MAQALRTAFCAVGANNSPMCWCFCRIGQPLSLHLCSKPEVLPGLTQTPTVNVRKEEHDDRVFSAGSPGSPGV